MQPQSYRAEAQRIWQRNRKKILVTFGEDRDKMALAEILALRQLALSAMADQTLASMRAPAVNKKFTR